ncbi:MAG: DNA repair protein RadA [Bacteroidetes bacterium]|nr:MAG: DNA repair protein RadA [Bacteroidota bacterium]
MKDKIVYICQSCGAQSSKWLGRCNECGTWGSLVEEVIKSTSTKIQKVKLKKSQPVKLDSISTDKEYRLKSGIPELDRVLGGGIIPGSLVLVGGDPGIGKSTLMLQMCGGLKNHYPLYVTGEESLEQIRFRSQRLDNISEELMLLAETNIEQIDYVIKSGDCRVVVVDSIQSVYTDKIDSAPGSVVQVRECASLLMQTAKQTGKSIFIIGHVTKEGIIAGPKLLEHMVDTVLQFEGEKNYSYRILRAAKNRFGSTNEIGIFEMEQSGLKEVKNPSEIFLAHRNNDSSGIAIVAAMEGSRPLLLEVQALVTPSYYGMPQRTVNGYDLRRIQMLLAVLEKRLGLRFSQHDVFVNIAGGLYLEDTSADLGIAAALVSSLRDKPVDPKTVYIGEIGLTGEVRSVSYLDQRLNEAQKLGFDKIIIPNTGSNRNPNLNNINLIQVERLSLALNDFIKNEP